MFRPKQQPSAFAVQSAPSAFAVPPPANAASAVGLPPLPQLHRSESEISLDAFGIFPSGAPRAPSTASVTSMISALRIGAIYAPDAKMMVRSPSIAYSTVSEFSAVGDAKDAAAARNNMPMQLVPEAVAQVFLPPSMDGSTPIDARIWNCVNGTGRYAQEDVDSTDFLAGTRQGPGGNVATISFYDGRTIKADEAVNQGFLKVRAPLSLRKQEEMENAGHETQRKMQSSLTLQGCV